VRQGPECRIASYGFSLPSWHRTRQLPAWHVTRDGFVTVRGVFREAASSQGAEQAREAWGSASAAQATLPSCKGQQPQWQWSIPLLLERHSSHNASAAEVTSVPERHSSNNASAAEVTSVPERHSSNRCQCSRGI